MGGDETVKCSELAAALTGPAAGPGWGPASWSADPLKMWVLLQTWMGNAWKFTSLPTEPSIHIGCTTGPDHTPVDIDLI